MNEYAREAAALGDEARAEVHVIGVDKRHGVPLRIHHLVQGRARVALMREW